MALRGCLTSTRSMRVGGSGGIRRGSQAGMISLEVLYHGVGRQQSETGGLSE